MDGARQANREVVFIAGTGHSGSTLLGMILGSHPRCFYAGEAGKSRYIGNLRKDERKRVCKMCGADCPIWGAFELPAGVTIYEELSRRTGCPVVVDSTKSLEWLHARIAEVVAAGAGPRLLLLERDGRAVVSSRVRKYPHKDPRTLIETWADKTRASRRLFEAFAHPKARVRYELLATEPEPTVRRVCEALGLGFVPEMLEFYAVEHHPLGGNNGAQFLAARVRGASPDRPYARLSPRNREYYARHEVGIRLDTRWRTELGAEVLTLFEKLAGETNAESAWEG